MLQNERASSFVMVNCSCGRSLRAKADQIGLEVRCWDCHKLVLVPNPRRRERVARELSQSALVVIQGPALNSVLIGAVILTAVLAIPMYGVWLSAAALMVGGIGYYGATIRHVSQGSTDRPRGGLGSWITPWLIPEVIVSGLMAAGTVLPLWWINGSFHQSPHWDRTTWVITAAAWTLGPILMFLIFARNPDQTRVGFFGGLKTLVKHPMATSLALAIVPITLLMAEITITFVIYLAGHLPFYALDYMPMPLLAKYNEAAIVYSGIPHYHMVDYRCYPVSMFEKGYMDGILHGYSFVGAMPASLSMPTRAGMNAEEAIGLMGPSYLILRLLFVVTIVTSLLAGLAIQAHWLGSIAAFESKKPSSGLPTAGPPAILNPLGS